MREGGGTRVLVHTHVYMYMIMSTKVRGGAGSPWVVPPTNKIPYGRKFSKGCNFRGCGILNLIFEDQAARSCKILVRYGR